MILLCTAGLDVHKTVIYEHSKKLLGNLVVVLACRDDAVAACEARLIQHDISLHSPSLFSLSGEGADSQYYGVLGTAVSPDFSCPSALAHKSKQLIKFIATR